MLIDVDKRWELSCIENRPPHVVQVLIVEIYSVFPYHPKGSTALFNDFPFIRLSSSRLAKSRCAVSLKRLNAASQTPRLIWLSQACSCTYRPF